MATRTAQHRKPASARQPASANKKAAPKTDRKTEAKVAEVMHAFKEGKLKSGSTGKPVKNPKQAVAIGLSEARKAGAKLPPPPTHR